ncbi:hypothetical protein KOW79_014968 [Hemibagrus wyckioides]|uniref:Uncharacterized protein n=1 Tax=Hemibagrus wyckioides TaxID=337641 RepID=A0A9D3NJF8_9TELE|nr:hypothetical protein KOW79_014968 [Hemibagrus wyckioides]
MTLLKFPVQPGRAIASVSAAHETSARSRQRRKRLLKARQSVLAADEAGFWRGITADMIATTISSKNECSESSPPSVTTVTTSVNTTKQSIQF